MKIGKIKYGNLAECEGRWFVMFNAFRALRQIGFRNKEALNKYLEFPLHPSSHHLIKNNNSELLAQDGQFVQFIIYEDLLKKSGIKCHVCEESSSCECKINYGKINEIVFQKEKTSINSDYWKERCLAAEKYISLSLIEPSDLSENTNALDSWQKLKNKNYY